MYYNINAEGFIVAKMVKKNTSHPELPGGKMGAMANLKIQFKIEMTQLPLTYQMV